MDINNSISLKKILLMFTIGFMLIGNKVLASDNVLQAIQVDGSRDSYNIILKSDDVADVKKIVQAPNKMVLALKGIRASKTINTIYNNTSNVDSVVVEPTGDDGVKISIQADNVADSEVHFDTLKTPLGVLDKSAEKSKSNGEVVLSDPIKSYQPVYNEDDEEDSPVFSLPAIMSYAKNTLKSAKPTWVIAFGMFLLIVMLGLKTIKSKDNEIKVGLSQSLKDREMDMYKGIGVDGINVELTGGPAQPQPNTSQRGTTGTNYGLRVYQQGTRSPYLTSEMQRPRPAVSVPSASAQSVARNLKQNSMTNIGSKTIQKTALQTARTSVGTSTRPKATNIDSIKFLESMTKIYEKNGRTDLAQGLKANMKKAKANLV